MNGIALFDALARVDEQFIDCICGEVSCPPAKARRSSRRLRTIVAVCVGLFLVAGAVLVPRWNRPCAASGLMLMAVESARNDVETLRERIEFSKWDSRNDYYDETQPESVQIEILGDTVLGSYQKSLFVYTSFVPRHMYRAEDKSLFWIDSKGELKEFRWAPFDRKNAGERISEEEAITLACELFEELTPYKATDYSVSYSYVENMQINEIVFQKFLNGIPTADKVQIDLYRDGRPRCFASYELGMIPDYVDRTFDLEKLDQNIIEYCENLEQIKDAKDNNNLVDYSDWTHIITIDDKGQYYVLAGVTILFKTADGEIILNESIRLAFIQLN